MPKKEHLAEPSLPWQIWKKSQFVEVDVPLLHDIMAVALPQVLDPSVRLLIPEAKEHSDPAWRAIISRRRCSALVIPGAARADDATRAKMAKKVVNCIVKLYEKVEKRIGCKLRTAQLTKIGD